MFTKINETQAVTAVRYSSNGTVEYHFVLVPSVGNYTDYTKNDGARKITYVS